MLVPWLFVTAMALIPWLPAGLSLPTLLFIMVGINGVGGTALAYRYWYSRSVRLRGVNDVGVRFAMRKKQFAHEVAKLNELELKSNWLPVGW